MGGVYLTFLLPGVMGLFAQVDPASPGLWRSTFGLVALRRGVVDPPAHPGRPRIPGVRGPFRRHRWLVGVLYLVIVVLGVAPELAATVGLSGLQAAALAVVCLVVLAHGLAWELLTTTDAASRGRPARRLPLPPTGIAPPDGGAERDD